MRRRMALLLALAVTVPVIACQPEADNAKTKHAPLSGYSAYDPSAKGEELVAAATAKARAENKRVLLVFGGNWCSWCTRLDAVFRDDKNVKMVIDKHYVVVHVDSDNNGALNSKYNNPFVNGFPVMLVLDGDGKVLHTQAIDGIERDDKVPGYDADKVVTFLKAYAPPVG